MMLGEKSEGRNQSLFFLENINFWKFSPRTPELEYLSLLSVYLDMPHCPQCVTQTHDGNHFHSYTCRGGGGNNCPQTSEIWAQSGSEMEIFEQTKIFWLAVGKIWVKSEILWQR